MDNSNKIQAIDLLKPLDLPYEPLKSIIGIATLKHAKETNREDLPNNLLIKGITPNTK